MKEMKVHSAVRSKWIIPVDTDGDRSTCRILQDHTLGLTQEGRIAALLPNSKFDAAHPNLPGGLEEMSPNHVIIPGLINAHTHAAMSLLRGYSDNLSLQEWLEAIWEAEAAAVSPEFVKVGSLVAAYEALKSGTTCLNDMYFLPEDAEAAFKSAKIRSALGESLLNVNDRVDKEAEVKKTLDYAEKKTTSLVQPTVLCHSCYAVPEDWIKHLKEKMDANPIFKTENDPPQGIFHIHLHETQREVKQVSDTYDGRSAILMLDAAGLLSEKTIAAHCVWLTEAEIKLLAARKVNVCHCPKSNMKLASGLCPVQALLDAGVNVCLGTDGPCSNNSLDMLSEMQYASLLAKAVTGNPSSVDDYTALRMATRNGAKALGRLHDIGSLEVGKQGDFVAVSLDAGELAPIYDALSHLVYTTQREVTNVWVGGERVVKDGKCLTIEFPQDRVNKIGDPLKALRAKRFGLAEETSGTPSTSEETTATPASTA